MLIRRYQIHIFFALAVFVMFGLFACEEKEKKESTKKEVPQAVKIAFTKTYPNAKIKNVKEEIQDGKVVYEVESRDGKTARDLIYLPDGQVLEMEESCPVSAFPAVVQKAIIDSYPEGEINKSEKLSRGKVTEFEVVIEVGKQKNTVVLDSAGKIIQEQKADEEKQGEKAESKGGENEQNENKSDKEDKN